MGESSETAQREATEPKGAASDGAGGARPPLPIDEGLQLGLWAVAGSAVLLSLGGGIGFGGVAALGVALGGALATANLLAFIFVVRGMLRGGRVGRLWSLAGAFKFLVLVGLAWLVLKQELATGLSLVVGYGALPIGLTISTIVASSTGK